MKEKSNGISLDYFSNYYSTITPAEKRRFRQKQIGLVDLRKGEKVLKVGFGTGLNLSWQSWPLASTGEVKGIDIAPKMISRARKKALKANLNIGFHIASIDELPSCNKVKID